MTHTYIQRGLCTFLGAAAVVSAACFASTSPALAGDLPRSVVNGRIGFVAGTVDFRNYWTKDAKECPEGFNIIQQGVAGTRPPESPDPRLTFLRRYDDLFPENVPELRLPFHDVKGNTAYGVNLDGKVGPNDFTDPDTGEKGIDNAYYHITACTVGFRPEGYMRWGANNALVTSEYNRVLVEVSGVDDLVNDDSVDVTFYRGKQPLIVGGNGLVPYSTQQIEWERGKNYIYKLHGRIKNGILTTDPGEVRVPHSTTVARISDVPVVMHGAQLKIKLTPEGAEGYLGGYADIKFLYRVYKQNTFFGLWGMPGPDLYKLLNRFADAYPDPKTGKNTAISAALYLNMVQAYIQHPSEETEKQTASVK